MRPTGGGRMPHALTASRASRLAGDANLPAVQGAETVPGAYAGQPRRVRDRSVPPPPTFDPRVLPDSALLTAKELAGWLRLALSTLADWRSQHRERGPAWVLVAGMPRYRMGDV